MLKIIVIKNQYPIGILTQSDSNITFQYYDEIQEENYLKGLDKAINISNKLFPIFENLLPENEQLDFLKHKYNIKNEIEVLLYLNNIHGSFEFYTEDNYNEKEFIQEDIFIYNDKVEEILNQKYQFPNILEYSLDIPNDKLYPVEFNNSKITGLSGFQYKFSVVFDKKNQTIKYDNSNKSEYIMKPYNKGYSTFKPLNKDSSYIPYLLINEHIFMSIARDFHAKNISLIYKTNSANERDMQLAPYYDISTVGIYKEVDDNDIGMQILNKNKKITLEDFIWLGSNFSISEDDVRKDIVALSIQFKDTFISYIDLLPLSIKSLPYYKNRYMNFDSLDVLFKKYYDKRVLYIDKYLLKSTKNTTSIWD